MNPCRAAKNEPAKPANIAPIENAESLVLVVSMPSDAAGDLVLAQRFPGAPDRQPPQPHASRRLVMQRETEDDVIEEQIVR